MSDDTLVASQSGRSDVYLVEARICELLAKTKPTMVVHGMTITPQWQRVVFAEAQHGVYAGPFLPPGAQDHQWLDFEAAEALAAWFRAGLERASSNIIFRPLGLETRLVKVSVEYSWKAVREHEYAPVSADGNRRRMASEEPQR